MTAKTATDAFGREIADRLAAIAIDLLCDAPATQQTYTSTAKVSWRFIHEGRAILDDAGVDWRAHVRRQVELRTEARAAARDAVLRDAGMRP